MPRFVSEFHLAPSLVSPSAVPSRSPLSRLALLAALGDPARSSGVIAALPVPFAVSWCSDCGFVDPR